MVCSLDATVVSVKAKSGVAPFNGHTPSVRCPLLSGCSRAGSVLVAHGYRAAIRPILYLADLAKT